MAADTATSCLLSHQEPVRNGLGCYLAATLRPSRNFVRSICSWSYSASNLRRSGLPGDARIESQGDLGQLLLDSLKA